MILGGLEPLVFFRLVRLSVFNLSVAECCFSSWNIWRSIIADYLAVHNTVIYIYIRIMYV